MTTRLRRSIATLLAALIYVQAIVAGPYPPPAAVPLIRLGPPAPAPLAVPAPSARLAPLATKAPYAPFAPYARYAPSVAAAAEVQAAEPVVVFGPNQYVRTTGAPNIYTVSFALPAGVTGPYTMHVVNGSPSGTNRLSSTTILLNGVEVAVPGDFGQSVAGFDKVVTLQAQNNVELRVTSIPTGYLTLSFLAMPMNGDQTPPELAITSPIAGTFVNGEPTTITVQASDTGSGIAPATLHILIDGTDRVSEFTFANGTATAQIGGLTEGAHTIAASVADVAGNPASASASFTIDRTAPQIVIVDPAANQYTNAQVIDVGGGVIDATATTVVVDGTPAMVTGAEFMAGAIPVGAGPTQDISVFASDAAGNTTTATVTINIDRVVPVVAFTTPAENAVLKGPILDVSGTVSDASTVHVTVNGDMMTVTGGTFSGQVAIGDGSTTLHAIAQDVAGNQATADLTVVVDTVKPTLTILEPAPNTITNQASILVRVGVNDSSATTVTAGGVTLTPVGGVFEATLPLPSEGTNLLIVTAVDAAGNEELADVLVVSDRSAPELAITSPAPGAVVPELPVTVSGTVTDLTGATVTVNGAGADVNGATWSTTLTGLPEGDTTFTVVARDVPGNESSKSRTITIDLNAPVVTIATPQSGLLTAAGTVTVSGTVQDVSVLQVFVNGVDASLDPAQPGNAPRGFTATVPIAEGDNTIVASATDGAQRPGSAQVLVTRDATPPAIALTVGPKVTRARPAAASIIATDLALDRITVSVNGTIVHTFTAPPYVLNISAPEESRPGDVLTIVAEAIDRVGNTAQATAQLPVASDGAVVGQVLSDVTGLPIANPPATVSIDDASAITTDDRGRYSFATGEPRVSLSATAPGMTTVDRAFDVASEAGTVALDARLTPIAPATSVGAAPATIAVAQSGAPAFASLSLIVPDGAFADGSSINATALSAQGLPGLLPLGWAPVAAIDLRGPVPAAPLSLRAQNAGTQTLYLARYLNRTWYLASEALTPDGDGTVTVVIPSSDAIALALVTPDTGDGAPAVPAIGDPLPGVEPGLIPITATSAGVLNPPTLSPGGGTSIGTLTVTSPTALPSGTVVQAVVTETFTLSNGDTISTDARTQDFVLYRSQADIVAVFPVVPSRSFATADLVSGIVHLDILAGRETVRGQAGGSGAVTLTTTGATLSVAQGALTDDVPIVFQSAVLSSFLPSTGDVSPLLEFAVDFSGRTLSIGAEFSILASQLTNIGPEDALVVVRVDSLEGRSRLVPVAVGELVGDRYIARALHGLTGITKGGRHVWYRVAGGVGFVRGFTDAGGTAFSTIVEVSGLPFASVGAMNGQYAAVSRPGAVTVRARAQGTSLVGEGDADVTVNAETALSITLNGEVTAAIITPADGAIQVSPAIQVEVASAVSITGASVATATIQFLRTSDPAGAVPYRVVLSGSGRTLAIVPLARLAEGATYSVAITGLADAVGGAVTVPPTSFTITSNSSPQYDLDKLVFSFPDADGRVRLTGPAGTLAPGSTILVVNETTGEVSTLPVFNDGSVGDFLVAQISDRLIVTITDLQGRQTTFKRSEYVAEDGTTAVGAGGGEVMGAGGVEVRIPEDAVMNGVAAILKIAAITPDQLPAGPLPEIDVPSGVATVATSLKIESTNTPGFQKEVDLVFPKPPDAPENAVYFVYRRLVGPEGRIAYETIDFADVEGEGANAKVVTASDPFSGYIDSIDGFSLAGFNHGGAVGGQLTNYAILMFYFDLAMPGRALGGTITGKVLRVKWDPGATTPTYEPVAGATISGVDVTGQPLIATAEPGVKAAKSQANGTYALYDRWYEGGGVTLSAIDPVTGLVRTVIAYEVDPQNTKSPGLRFSRHVATANIIFPAIAPAVPPSPVVVSVMTPDGIGGRQPSNGIVVAGEPIVIGVTAADMTVQRVEVKLGTQVTEYGVRVDPLAAQKSPNAFDVIADDNVSLPIPGSYTIKATALNPAGGIAEGYVVVRATAAGGGNNDSLPGDPPAVITVRTVPRADTTGVQIGILPQIVFTEPVQNVPAGVTLTEEGGGTIGVLLSGVGPQGPIAELTPASIITSLTIQPSVGLKFGTRYTLSLSSEIHDTDDGINSPPAHKPLQPYTTSFRTFAPESIGQSADSFTAGGFAVIGDRAYVATPQNAGRWFTNLRLFDLGDPTFPREIGTDMPGDSQIFKAPPAWWLGVPVDVVAEQNSELTGGNLVAVATNPLFYPYHPANVRLYDVSNDGEWQWVGAVSLGREPIDGMIRRIEMRGSQLYAVTAGVGKGIQVVDLDAVRSAFDSATAGGERTAAFWNMQGQLNGSIGFAQEAILQTIYVDTVLPRPEPIPGQPDPPPGNSQLWDLGVVDITVDGILQPVVVATGRSPLVVALAQTGELSYNENILDANGAPMTSWGFGAAAGYVGEMPIAVISALGPGGPAAGTHVLAIVDLTDPRHPRSLNVLPLPGSAYDVQDVVLRDTTVFIGTNAGTYVVSVADPFHPQLVGTIASIRGRLAFDTDGVLYGTYRGLTEVTHAQGGLRTAVLDTLVVVELDTDHLLLNEAGSSVDDLPIRLRIIPTADGVLTERLTIRDELGTTLYSQDLAPSDVNSVTWPSGQVSAPEPRSIAFEVRSASGQRSGPVAGQTGSSSLGPELQGVLPQRVTRTTNSRVIELRGLRFTGFSRAVLLDLDGEEYELDTEYLSTTRLEVTIPGEVLGIIGDRSITVVTTAHRTESLPFRVVMPSNAVAPQVQSAEPNEVPVGFDGEWITVRGSAFVDGDTVGRIDRALGNLPTEVLSSTEMRVLLPPAFLLKPATLLLRAVSAQDPDLASDDLPVQILGLVVNVPAPPSADFVVDRLALMSGVSETARPVTIRGSNFEPGAEVLASIDHGAFVPLPTTVISDTEIRGTLPRDMWRERYLEISGQITKPSGTQESVKVVRKVQPNVNVKKGNTQLTSVAPTIFHAGGRYLLDAKTGKHNGSTFKQNPEGFQFEITDPSQPDLGDANKAYVRLESKDSTGANLDSIVRLQMDKFSKGIAYSKSSGEQIVGVTDGVDDGRVLAPDVGRFGSEVDGSLKDPTIEVRVGGELQVTYRNLVKNITIGPVAIPVSPQPKQLRVRAYRVTDSAGQSLWTDAAILSLLTPSSASSTTGPTAADIYAAAGIELALASPGVQVITSPHQGAFWHTPVAPPPCRMPLTGPRLPTCPLSGDYLSVIGQRFAADVTDNVLSLFFVDYIAQVGASGTPQKSAILGQAVTDIGTSLVGGGAAPISLTGAAFISVDAFHVTTGTVPSNGKTVAHEIAHVVFSIDAAQILGGGFHVDTEALNILRSGSAPNLSLLKKRLNSTQRTILLSGKVQGTSTLTSRFIR